MDDGRVMLNLNDLYFFVQVVDHGGFAPASRRIGTPKSTLAKRVAALESDLGVRLIQRSSRRFAVTELGQDFYRHAAAMLIEAEAAENIVKGRLAEPSGIVRITASIPTAQNSLTEPLLELAHTYPKIRIALHATDRFVDLVQEGFDIAVRDHFAPLPDSGLVQRRVCRDPTYLVASPAYIARRGMPQNPDDLANHDGLITYSSSGTWLLENENGERAEGLPMPRMAADESGVLLRAAASGFGIACLPRKLCESSLRSGVLVRMLPGWTAGFVTTTLLMPHRRGQLPSVRAVADMLADRIPMT
jgi:DNA-binding transcriptional LysR family regulator